MNGDFMKRLAAGLAAAGLAIGWGGQVMAGHVKEGRPVQKIVFQVSADDAKLWGLTANYISNVITNLGKANVEIKVVA